MKNRQSTEILTIPNILSCLRMGLGLLLLHIAWQGRHTDFIIVLVIAFFLDLIDGPIARLTNQVTEIGPKLDSWADFSIYMALPIGAWWLWPEIILREKIYVGLTVASVVVPTIVGFIKFRQPTSYHTWLTKFAVVCTAPSVIILLLEGPAWPFQVASIICVLAGLEETTITFISKKAQSDVKSLFHLLNNRKVL